MSLCLRRPRPSSMRCSYRTARPDRSEVGQEVRVPPGRLGGMARRDSSPPEHVDVVIVGAGLSGVGAAYRLQTERPGTTYAVLEARQDLGGTWDLFRYPGARSDSDMYTLGYAFKPWRDGKSLADGPSILAYIRETAAENGIEEHIRFSTKVVAADFDTATARWHVTTEDPRTGERGE